MWSVQGEFANSMTRALRRTVSVFIIFLVASGLVAVSPSSGQVVDFEYESDPILAGGVDGNVWTTELVGSQVWIGGTFSNVRNFANAEEPDVPSQNLAIFDINSGLVAGRTFVVDGPVWDIKYHDRVVYVAGAFSDINETSVSNLVAFDASTGELLESFTPVVDAAVHSLLVHDGHLYAGGTFRSVDGNALRGLARFDLDTQQVDTGFAPRSFTRAEALAAHGDLLYVGERNTTGALIEISAQRSIRGVGSAVWDAAFSPEGERLFVALSSNEGAVYDRSGSRLRSVASPGGGDVQAVAVTDTHVLWGSHGNNARKILATDHDGRNTDDLWFVEMDSYWGVNTILTTPQAVVIAGDFTSINGLEARRIGFFRPLDAWPPAQAIPVVGDVDRSGSRDGNDVNAILSQVVGLRADIDQGAADIDGDDVVGLRDAVMLAQQAVPG